MALSMSGRKDSIFSSVSTISTTIGRSLGRRRLDGQEGRLPSFGVRFDGLKETLYRVLTVPGQGHLFHGTFSVNRTRFFNMRMCRIWGKRT